MNYTKPFVISFLGACAFLFMGTVSSVVCSFLLVQLKIYISLTVFFTLFTLSFFIAFCYFGEKVNSAGAKPIERCEKITLRLLFFMRNAA